MGSVGEGRGHQTDKDEDLFQRKQERGMFRERKEFDATGPRVVWALGMGCEARKDGHIKRDFVCLAVTIYIL